MTRDLDFAANEVQTIVFDAVSKRYGDVLALDRVSFSVAPGELVVLLGPSGAGKSSVFRCLTQLVRPDQGSVTVSGRRLDRLHGAALRQARSAIGLVFQQHNLIGRLSVINNVLTGRIHAAPTWRVLFGRFGSANRQLALDCLNRVGLLEKAYFRADALSGGQQQRVAIARALAQQGQVLLADEPVASLDPESARQILQTLRLIAHDTGIAVLCSLHQVELARLYADRLIGLRAGRVIFDGRPAELNDSIESAIYAGSSNPDCASPIEPEARQASALDQRISDKHSPFVFGPG